jgi:hypothetical protein
MFSINSFVATRRRSFVVTCRGSKPTTKVIGPLRGAQAEHVSATAETSSKLRQINVAVRTVDGIVRNKYANDPGKLAAWASARHVEKAPKKKQPTP